MEKLQLPKRKGDTQQATAGVDCLLRRAKDLLTSPVIAEMPEFEQPTVPKAMEIPETIRRASRLMKIEDRFHG